ncbi:MAG TPA: glutamate synthase [Thermodesulfobacteriota bacterium]|nr:glutamate synthase [Thermodesulfobacteriota bacterium]
MSGRLDANGIISSRRDLIKGVPPSPRWKAEEEGGCGVTGFASSIPVGGRHIIEPSRQMHNRGNGKGGGLAAVGLSPECLGVSADTLRNDYLLQIAYLDTSARASVEAAFIEPFLEVHEHSRVPTVNDYREVEGLEVAPPDVYRYFVRVKQEPLRAFAARNNWDGTELRKVEDEFIFQNSFNLNRAFYASLGEKKAFVLSHGRDMMILKIVGYAEQVAQYYRLEDFKAHIWIAHQRYPTKGRVWHPGGAHPFSGMHEALVHNGDFANYHSVCEYLRQYNLTPLFLTDTEVSVQLFDLLSRVMDYPLEHVIEALAPTGELDFDLLPPDKQAVYREIQAAHIHGSPDGPWFFIIARSDPYRQAHQLIGITDTAMLRPQVFALSEGEVQIGLICSEKQAIDATLQSLSAEDSRFHRVADKYWNARGGSHTDGGAFIFNIEESGNGKSKKVLTCTDKFGTKIVLPDGQKPWDHKRRPVPEKKKNDLVKEAAETVRSGEGAEIFALLRREAAEQGYPAFQEVCEQVVRSAQLSETGKAAAIDGLTLAMDRRWDPGANRRSCFLEILQESLEKIFSSSPDLGSTLAAGYRRVDARGRKSLRKPAEGEKILVLDAALFPPEGDDSAARVLTECYGLGWRRFIVYGCRGQRFIGCGFGGETRGVRIDVYGSSGDYLGSGIDGMEVNVHGSAQDQLGQILKSGKLVVFGDVGQTFLYGAKGGDVYVLGNAAGRPLINAVGRPRVIINGTCLDYLAESFMAGDPHNGGGFVVLNGMDFDEHGNIHAQAAPYPGSNLFSLASGGALYVRDPGEKVQKEQLNGGEFAPLSEKDWRLILPYLEENERLFGISIDDLLTVDGNRLPPERVYRKVRAVRLSVLSGNQEWE